MVEIDTNILMNIFLAALIAGSRFLGSKENKLNTSKITEVHALVNDRLEKALAQIEELRSTIRSLKNPNSI